jgi:DNA invertase Pin-like site-specific DNA recombinase
MLRIGYVRLRDDDATGALKAAGCHVVRAEEPAGQAVLDSIFEFIGEGDQLVVSRIDQLGVSSRALLEAIDRLEARGATLQVLEPDLCSAGPTGSALRAVLEAVSRLEPESPRRRRAAAAVQEIRALQSEGVGPVEIARRLGVSRMTVWRKLRGLDASP